MDRRELVPLPPAASPLSDLPRPPFLLLPPVHASSSKAMGFVDAGALSNDGVAWPFQTRAVFLILFSSHSSSTVDNTNKLATWPAAARKDVTDNLSHLQQYVRQLLRPLGLRIAMAVKRQEPRKAVVYQSFLVVCLRSIIHVIPASVSLVIVALNLNGYFIGRSLQGELGNDGVKAAALQIAAKIQELFVISSLGSIILHLIRDRMLFGEGVPLGLLGSDKAMSQVSFFWSIDFWGGVLSYYKLKPWTRRLEGLVLVLLLAFGGLVALMAGPATAILMIPRNLAWPVGGGMFQLNRTEEILWPAVLDESYGDPSVCNTTDQRLSEPQCASGGFRAVYRTYDRSYRPIQYLHFDVDDGFLRKTINVEATNDGKSDTWAYTTHGPTADFQDEIIDRHTEAVEYLEDDSPFIPLNAPPTFLDLAETKLYQTETRMPLVRTICEIQPTLTRENATWQFAFAKFQRFEPHRDNVETGEMRKLDVFQDIRRGFAQRNVTLTPESNLIEAVGDRQDIVIPVNLPPDLNGSIGLLYLRPGRYVSDESLAALDPFEALTCTVDARWVQGRSSQQFDSFNDKHQPHGGKRDVTSNTVQAKLGPASYPEEGLLNSLSNLQGIDRGQIRIDSTWFDGALSPYIPDASLPGFPTTETQPNRTTAERLLQIRDTPNYIHPDLVENRVRRAEVEIALSAFFADGLSRCGADSPHDYRSFEAVTDDDKEGTIWARRQLVHHGPPTRTYRYKDSFLDNNGKKGPTMTNTATFTGYVIAATSPFDYFCIAVLLSHALVAILHTVWCCRRQFRTHETWDTIPQLVALAQQSPPEEKDGLLTNVCGGMESFGTAGVVAVVEERDGKGEGEELVLRMSGRYRESVVENGDGSRPPLPMVRKRYGSRLD